jgi:hypothetical protein
MPGLLRGLRKVDCVKSRIMYIERKGHTVVGQGRIGRVSFSKTGRTLRYHELSFRPVSGAGHKANYIETSTGEAYWISGPKRNGADALYTGIVEIDDDVREEYWTKIREEPDRIGETSLRSRGKYSR